MNATSASGLNCSNLLGFSEVRLMTNNPRKVSRMEDTGIRVTERVPLKAGKGTHNAEYSGHQGCESLGHLL